MKCLTVTQPFATLIACHAKTQETRSWRTSYRGPLAIHAAKGWPRKDQELRYTEPFRTVLQNAKIVDSFSQLPRGVIVATCTLVNCIRTEEIVAHLSPQEQAFGYYTPGRWAWVLNDVVALPEPIPARGALGLWEWTGEGLLVPA